MIHSGSRGLGHQVATDALVEMEAAMARDGISTNDRQLACARISSKEGQVGENCRNRKDRHQGNLMYCSCRKERVSFDPHQQLE